MAHRLVVLDAASVALRVAEIAQVCLRGVQQVIQCHDQWSVGREVFEFVTVEVEGPAEGRYSEALPGFTPFAFTNPIFVDVDGNGRFDAPGLPEVLPASITNPDQPD